MASKISSERVAQREKNYQRVQELFSKLGGRITVRGHTVIDALVQTTPKGVQYLQMPGIALVSKPQIDLEVLSGFLGGFEPELEFTNYINDETPLTDGSQIAKLGGQVCYMSFGPGRSKNVDAGAYIEDIKAQGHGSVLEHVNYSFLTYGTPRSESHERVRHRAGVAVSQLSQRYVGGRTLRFVERTEYKDDPELHRDFETEVEEEALRYERKVEKLLVRQKSKESAILQDDSPTSRRIRVRQAARSVLSNDTEVAMLWSANARALHHIFGARTSEHAEVDIRNLFFRMFLCTAIVDPILFSDFEIKDLPDGTYSLSSPYKKP